MHCAAVAAAFGGGPSTHAAEPKAKRWGKSRPYPARVVAVEPLCTVTNKQDKVRVRVRVVGVGVAVAVGAGACVCAPYPAQVVAEEPLCTVTNK